MRYTRTHERIIYRITPCARKITRVADRAGVGARRAIRAIATRDGDVAIDARGSREGVE